MTYEIDNFSENAEESLVEAVQNDNLVTVARLIGNGADVNEHISGPVAGGGRRTLLHYAQSFEMFQLLTNAKIKVNKHTLTYACSWKLSSNVQLVQWLLDYGLPVDGDAVHTRENAGDLTPLMCAALHGCALRASILLRNGANPNAASFTEGWHPLNFAAMNVKPDHDRQFLNRRETSKRRQRLDYELNQDVIALLLTAGANVDCRDNEGMTPLMRVAQKRDWQAAQTLLEAGANPHALDHKNRTAEWHAINCPKLLRNDNTNFSRPKTIKLIRQGKDRLHRVIDAETGELRYVPRNENP